LEIGKWVVAKFDKYWYPREISKLEDDEVEIKCMKRIVARRIVLSGLT